MPNDMFSLECSIVRGGTSKGIFIMDNLLPKEIEMRKRYIREIFGSPDLRQIDGLGGADVLTSKLAIIAPSTRADADVDYTFAQVSFVDDTVDFNSNCGNISAAVAPFAIDRGMVAAQEPVTTVRIHQVNTNSIITAKVRVKNGKPEVDGDEHIDGVPVNGSPIELDFSDAVGSLTKKLLPTGNITDVIKTDDGNEYEVSIVDVAIPTVFVRARDLGMVGNETSLEIEGNVPLMEKIEEIRGRCAAIMGFTFAWRNAKKESAYTPFISCVSSSQSDESDVMSRLLFMQRVHKTHPVTGTICMGAAARIPGSVVEKFLSKRGHEKQRLIIGHPAGVIPVISEIEMNGKEYVLKNASLIRTARIIMRGEVFLRYSRVKAEGR